jgi:hypothetical protein
MALTLFAMRLELARARALEGWRVGDKEGPGLSDLIDSRVTDHIRTLCDSRVILAVAAGAHSYIHL